MPRTEYRLINDDDGHSYVIPVDKADAFEEWLLSTKHKYANVPWWAARVDNPNKVVFPSWRIVD